MGGSAAATPNYRTLDDATLQGRVDRLRERYADCGLCAHDCGVDRTAGETGACRVDDTLHLSSHHPHFGEEDPLRGWAGSGTIFLAHCNMGCVFCQNYETSHEARGDPAPRRTSPRWP